MDYYTTTLVGCLSSHNWPPLDLFSLFLLILHTHTPSRLEPMTSPPLASTRGRGAI